MADITVLTGASGGLLATIVMTVFMMALGDDSPPPTAALWAKYVGDEGPEAYMPQGMALHVIYGISAATVFALAVPALVDEVTMVLAVALGLAYGLALTVVGAVVWMRIVLAMEPEPKQVGLFALFHLIYGGVLGAWVGAAPV